MSSLRRIATEPLVHFLLIGAALFALNALLPSRSADRDIVVTPGRVQSLVESFRRTWQRAPTAEERATLIEDFVLEEILVREALAAGLDRDDSVVRRRLRQKMDFIADETAAAAQPSDKDLADYLAANAAAFAGEPRISFAQEFLGGRLSMLEARYDDLSLREVERMFGREFAAALVKLPSGQWVQPVSSGYGAHRVRVDKVVPGATPALAEVRPQVEREWRNQRRTQMRLESQARLRSQYTVKVVTP